jgi:hypothetical protein
MKLYLLTLVLFSTLRCHAALVYEHPFTVPIVPTPTGACSSCGGSLTQVWDQFDLNTATRITEIHAQLSLPVSPWITSIELSIWDVSRNIKLFAQSYYEGELTLNVFEGPGTDVRATNLSIPLSAGSYTLSYYYSQPNRQFGWIESRPTVNGRSFQSGGGSAQNLDMAFRIIGSEVPEPSGAAPLMIFVLGIVWRSR